METRIQTRLSRLLGKDLTDRLSKPEYDKPVVNVVDFASYREARKAEAESPAFAPHLPYIEAIHNNPDVVLQILMHGHTLLGVLTKGLNNPDGMTDFQISVAADLMGQLDGLYTQVHVPNPTVEAPLELERIPTPIRS